MTLREAIYYTAICDLCGADSSEGGEYSAWASQEGANDDAEYGDWHVEGGNHICDGCVPTAFDLLDEDEIEPLHGAEGHQCYAEATVKA